MRDRMLRRHHDDPQDALAERITTVAGLTTLTVGAWMVLDPARAGRALSLPADPHRTQLMGLIDLALVPGLLAANRRRRWMVARAGYTAVLAANQSGGARRVSAGLAVLDAAAATRLQRG
jgi:hypothetical protein